MKYVYGMLGVGVILAVASWLYFSTNKPVAPNPEAPLLASVQVNPLADDVSLTSSDSGESLVITTEQTATDGSIVQTSADGRAIITRESSIISSLDNNTEITINLSPDKKESRLALSAGRIWSKIARALEQDEVFEVYTPTMVAAVRGTSFGVSLDPKRSLIVTEGTVYASRRNPETGELIVGTTIAVTVGNTVEDDGKEFTIRATTEADKDTWFSENNPDSNELEASAVPLSNPSFNTSTAPPNTTTTPTPTLTPTNTSSPPVTTNNLPTISAVSPRQFAIDSNNQIRIEGNNLNSTQEVLFNGAVVEFIITSTGMVVVESSEVRDGTGSYTVTINTTAGSVSRQNAFTVEEPLANLSITSAQMTFDQLQNSVIVVTGTDLDIVTTALVNGIQTGFTATSASRLEIPYAFSEATLNLELRGGGQTASANVSP